MIRLNLRFFAESSGEKTEKPTQKKKTKAREEGQVAKSQEISTAFMFIAMFFALKLFAPFMFTKLREVFYYSFTVSSEADAGFFTLKTMQSFGLLLFLNAAMAALPLLAAAMLVGVVANIVQVGWRPTTKPLKPKADKLNPMKGLKRLFSVQALVDLVKSLVKLGAIALVIYNLLNKEKGVIVSFLNMSLMDSVAYIANVVVNLGINVGMLYLFIAAVDYGYQRFRHNKQLKMTKQEVKEEYKQTEGNPQIKGKIRQRIREVSMRRMMQAVPNADVIITNPTHYAAALKYERSGLKAPVLTAKGKNLVALRIKEIAAEHRVVIVEDRPLARTLYDTVDIGKEIPPELYQAVAEILAYVYKLKSEV